MPTIPWVIGPSFIRRLRIVEVVWRRGTRQTSEDCRVSDQANGVAALLAGLRDQVAGQTALHRTKGQILDEIDGVLQHRPDLPEGAQRHLGTGGEQRLDLPYRPAGCPPGGLQRFHPGRGGIRAARLQVAERLLPGPSKKANTCPPPAPPRMPNFLDCRVTQLLGGHAKDLF